MTEPEDVRSPMSRGRLEAFSDGVFAVAITLLALNLTVAGPGHGSLAHQLTTRWPSFVAYIISFATIGIIWVNHHVLVRGFAVVDRLAVFLNLALLFFVVLLPFVTATVALYLRSGGKDAHLAVAIYGLVLECMSLSFFALFLHAIQHDLLAVPIPPEARRAAIVRFCVGSAGYLVVIGVAFVSPETALALSGLMALYYVVDRTPSQTDAADPASRI